MKVLVTGATGLLGRHVVPALQRRGHDVRALVRPAAAARLPFSADGVEVVHADLRDRAALGPQLDGVEGIVHLAASVGGDDDAQFSSTVVGTENLLAAMAALPVARLTLASSFTVYDWTRIADRLSEDSPTVARQRELDRRGGYTVAKSWQERLVREAAARQGFGLTVLRPGFIWAAGSEPRAGVGHSLGRVHLVFGPSRSLPLTYVENCADCFAEAATNRAALGQTLNVVDEGTVTARRFMLEYLRRRGVPGRPVGVPYRLALEATRLAQRASDAAFSGGGRLPSILVPVRFEARFKPLTFSTDRLRRVLGWTPPWSFEAALDRTYGQDQQPTRAEGASRIRSAPATRSI